MKDEELYLYYYEEISNFQELYFIIFDIEQNWYSDNFYFVSSKVKGIYDIQFVRDFLMFNQDQFNMF